MSLMLYVDEEIDERRGIEYLRRCSTADVFKRILSHVKLGVGSVRIKEPRAELDMSCSFELLRTGSNHTRLVRVRLVVAKPTTTKFQRENFAAFLIALDPEGSVIGVFTDALDH